MKVKELIEILSKTNPEADVTITDGFEAECYHTNNVVIKLLNYCDYYHDMKDSKEQFLDIGIGGNKLK